jgi:hypothetical protein
MTAAIAPQMNVRFIVFIVAPRRDIGFRREAFAAFGTAGQ